SKAQSLKSGVSRMNTAHKYDDQVIIPTIAGQLELLSGTDLNKELAEHVFHEAPDIDLSIYDIFIVCLSGGKDSIAAYLRLLEAGVGVVSENGK
ncbi:MAG: hypothetical protein RR845_25110, partial [Pseudomonas sp.]